MQAKDSRVSELDFLDESFPPNLIAIADEEEVIGGLFLAPDSAMAMIEGLIEPEHFYLRSHQDIFRAALSLYHSGQSTDMLSVAAWLRDRDLLEKLGGQSKLVDLFDRVVGTATIDLAAKRVAEKAKWRLLRQLAGEINALCKTPSLAINDAIEQIDAKLFSLSDAAQSAGLRPLGDFLVEEQARMERVQEGLEPVGIATGFYDLDAVTQGLKPQTLWILGGRPSMGKSALAAAIARNVAVQNIPVALFSLEMSGGQIGRRLLSAEAQIENHRLVKGTLTPAEVESYWRAHAALSAVPLKVDDSQSISMGTIRAQCRRMKAEHGRIGLILVDYLHLMLDGNDDEVRELGQITRQFKRLSRELNCCVMVLSQLSRGVESRDNKRPRMSDLRQSGNIEQDADLVTFIYRDEYYNPDTSDRGMAEVIIAKQRDGATGTVKLLFESQYSRFRNLKHYV